MMMRHSTGIDNNRNLFYIKGKSCTSNMKEERERETVCVCYSVEIRSTSRNRKRNSQRMRKTAICVDI